VPEVYKIYFEKRLNDDFSIYLLFDDALQFDMEEIVEAAIDDFPEMREWRANVITPEMLDTSSVCLGFIANEVEGRSIKITGMPGLMDVDFSSAYRN